MIDYLRNEELINEREAYEDIFFSMEDILKSEEWDFTIFQYLMQHDFLFEDECIRLHDKSLIEEMQSCQTDYPSMSEDEIIEKDTLDLIIESSENSFPECRDYDFYGLREDFYEWGYFEKYDMDAAYYGHDLLGYVVSDDHFDSLDGCDYPEGPDENINGLRYHEPEYYEDFSCDFECPEISIDDYCDYQFDVAFHENQELHMQKLIEEHLKEEKEYLDCLLQFEVCDEYFLPFEGDDIIFC